MKKLFLCYLCLCFLLTACSNSNIEETTVESNDSKTENTVETFETIPQEIDKDYITYFGNQQGTVALFDSNEGNYHLYNAELAKTKVSPCSTFKIISTLVGLKQGVLTDSESTMGYDGTRYPNPVWNDDLTLKKAFQTSCIWYFRKVIDKVGKTEIQKELDNLHYGNTDISEWQGSDCNPLPDLNGFWLQSSLQISPYEQVNVLKSIFEDNTLTKYTTVLKDVMMIEGSTNYQLYGKTGTGADGIGWFCGMAEKDSRYIYFAVLLEDGTGAEAQSISTNILNNKYFK